MPTKTEILLYGKSGASDSYNPFRLERDLISPSKWGKLYDEMPVQCQSAVDESYSGTPIGIGRNDKVGWFVLGFGQGPFVIWLEHEN